jgi:hypothetical protein
MRGRGRTDAEEESHAMTTVHEGGCLCGRTRFAFHGAPRVVGNCHCDTCRRWSGAAMSTFVCGRDDQVTWSGEPAAVFVSSPGVERRHCAACGTALAYRSEQWPGETHVMLGAFDDPAAFKPKGDVFVEEALPWLAPQVNRG